MIGCKVSQMSVNRPSVNMPSLKSSNYSVKLGYLINFLRFHYERLFWPWLAKLFTTRYKPKQNREVASKKLDK